jgi:apolipoprotein N-acyltransferase
VNGKGLRLPAALLAAGASGALLSAANPPVDLGPLAFVALVPLLLALRHQPPRRGFLLGLGFGVVYYGLLLDWLLRFGLIAWLPLVVSQSAYSGLFGLGLSRLWDDARPARSAIIGAALWTALDWIRSVWPLGGFGWGALGNTQHGNGWLLPLASVTGVWGVSFVVVLANGLLLGAGLRKRRAIGEWRRALALVAAAAAPAFLPGLIPLPTAMGPGLDVAVVQGNVPRELASDRLLQSDVVGENHIRLNRELASDPPDLAIWPENSLDNDPTTDSELGGEVADSIRAVGSTTLVGAITDAPGGRYYNQALLYSGDGQVLGRYTKMHLVPFGEYVPWRPLFSWTDRFRPTPRDLAPGREIELFQVQGVTVATPICFENVFPDLFRRFVAAGAQVVVLTTNDSSFLESVASREHVIMSQIRAVETGRWIVQGAISGESAIVDPRGRVLAHTELFEQTILRFKVPTSNARTIYVRLGDWFPWVCGGGVLLAFGKKSARRRRATPPAGERPGATIDAARPPVPISGGSDSRVLVVLPTYNERATILQVLRGVLAAGSNVDALVVDDTSPDGTADAVEVLAGESPRVRLLRRPGKQGLASAYLEGFHVALREGYDVVVEMDSDLSHRPEDLPKLIEGSAFYDLTIGSRYVPGGEVTNWSRPRVALSRAGNAYARVSLRLPLTDATSGFRAYRRRVLEALMQRDTTSEGYAFQIEMAYRAFRAGFTLGEIPITFREREHGASKLSRRIVFEALLKVGSWGLRDRLPGRRGSQGADDTRSPGLPRT